MKKYFILIGAAVTLGSCEKYLDVNKNPNTPEATSAPARNVFTNAVNAATGYQVGGSHSLGSTWSGVMSHSTSFTGGGEEKTYEFSKDNFNHFDGAYDILFDFQNVINGADAQGVGHLKGPAKVMQCLIYQKLVDQYGDIPYTEALQGTDFFSPAYDNQQTVYESLITKLTEAIADIKSSTFPSADDADIIFGNPNLMLSNPLLSGGDSKVNWVKFANSLKLRILMRQSFMPGRLGYIQSKVAEITAEGSGFMTTAVVSSNPGYLKQLNKLNPYYGTYGYSEQDQETGTFRFRKMNAVIVNYLKSADLFRLQRLATPKKGGTVGNTNDYTGVPLGPTGAPAPYVEDLVSGVGSVQAAKYDATRRMLIMTPAEVYLNIAEAQLIGVTIAGTAKTSYDEGVKWAFRIAAAAQTGTATASVAQADAAAASYTANATLFSDYAAATTDIDRRRSILIQKWLALTHIDGLEQWSEYRKASGAAGYSTVLPTSVKSFSAGSNPEPVRLLYPRREEQVNGAHVPAGIDRFTSKIFWDVN